MMPHAGRKMTGLALFRIAGALTLMACGESAPTALQTTSAGADAGVGPNVGQPTDDEPDAGVGQPPSGTSVGIPCETLAILRQNCGTCHGEQPKFGAASTLVTWDGLDKTDPRGSGKRIRDLVVERINGQPSLMPPAPAPKLSDKDKGSLESWIRGGAPKSSDVCAPADRPGSSTEKMACEPDLKIRPAKPFQVQEGAPLDQYVCYGFDVTNNEKRHVIGMAPFTDNTTILHHILLFETDTAYSTTPVECDFRTSARWRLVTGWAPGGQPAMFPAEAGWPQEKGVTHYVLQLHYNNAQKLPNQKDSTGYDFCTSNKLRPNDAGMLAFGKVDLIRNQIAIPARSNLHEVECSYTLPNNVPEIRFFAASPHMHKFGKTSSTYYTRAGSTTPTKLIDVKEFGFDSQVSYPVSGAAKAGDRFKTRCGWTNPSDKTVYWGEGTGDEMCYNFTMYYPRVPDVPSQLFGLGGFNWGTPSLESTCQVVSK